MGGSGPDIATIFIKNEPAKYMIPFSLKIFYGNNDTERAIQLFYKYKREIESHRYLLMNQTFTVKQLTVACKNPQTELYLNDFAWSMNCIQESLGFLNQARICACNQSVEAVIPFGWSIEKQMKQDIMLYLGLNFVFFAELESF